MDGTSEKKVEYDDFLHLGVGQLKDYLSLRGISTSGNKAVLVARAFVAAEDKDIKIKYSEEQQKKMVDQEYAKTS